MYNAMTPTRYLGRIYQPRREVHMYDPQIPAGRCRKDFLFIYQYIYPGWAGYKDCILPQRPAENSVQEKSKYIQ